MTFAGKVVLITGGAGGIGLALVKELLKHDVKGVAIVDIAEARGRAALSEIKEFDSDRVIFIKTDITNETEFEDAFNKTVETYSQLDIVINNAGILDEVDGWDKTLQVNLVATMRGSYLAMQKYLPKYKSGEEGIIVNTASIVGLKMKPFLPAYMISKNGVILLGQALGFKEFYEKYKVKIVTVCPGSVATQFVREKKVLFPANFKEQGKMVHFIVQTSQKIAENYIKIIEKGNTGSVWVTEDNGPPYEIEIPKINNLRSLSKQD